MHVLTVSANDPMATTGGAERTMRQFLGPLVEDGHDVSFVAHHEEPGYEEVAGFGVRRTDEFRPRGVIEEFVVERDVDVVLCHAAWTDLALEVAAEHDVPAVHSMRSPFDVELARRTPPEREPARALAPSEWLASQAEPHYDCEVTPVHSPIDFEHYDLDGHDPEATTLVNPIREKGGFVFRDLAERNPDRSFLAKMGWLHFRDEEYDWRPEFFEIARLTIDDEAPPPEEPDLDAVPNVEFVREGDIREIYRRTRVLLVPSQGTPAFGRTPLEAMWNGIPVVASDCGGLPEACGDAGILVEEYDDVAAWEAALERLDDPEVYEAQARAGRERAERFRRRQPELRERFREVVEAAAAEN